MTPGWGNSTDLDRLMPGPVRVVNSFYGRLTHKQVKRGSHQTACGATIRHGFEETWEPDVFKDRTVADYLCRRCFPSANGAEKPRQGPVVPFPFPQPSDDEADKEGK